MTNHIITATQARTLPTKKARKTPRKVEKKEEPRLLENTALEAQQEESVSSPTELTSEKMPSVHASLAENEEGRENEVPSRLLH
jgi:hypothetical protein